MQKEYLPKIVECYAQEYWRKNKTFEVSEDTKKEKYYCLPMLPYPSGKLHMGHVRNYTISDVISRYQRMLGKNVLQPIGWDAFGLPAEEAAIQNNTVPSIWTHQNIKYMKKQLQSLGFSYDWSRELTTCKPEYYRWEQWFFIELYKKNLVYKKNSLVNWCPYDKTVLANEQVINGLCWRCQSVIKIKKIPQWFIKIRKYAENLYQDLKNLKHWPEKVKNMQKNWIGRSKGFEITLKILGSSEKIKVFTNRLDLIMATTYICISSSHKLSNNILKKTKFLKNFINNQNYKNISQKEIKKTKFNGFNTNIFAIHPITKKKIPIWISDFITQTYGTDAVISTPGHNENDWYFAKQNKLKIKYVIKKKNNKNISDFFITEKGILFNSGLFNNFDYPENVLEIKKKLSEKKIIKKKITYKLQDWCISRQRYWGTPIPMAIKKNGETIPIPENELPVTLPEIKNCLNLSSQNFFKSHLKWLKIKIKNEDLIREQDTFDTFMESSWYYARYTCAHFNDGMIDPKSSKYWLPIDQYIGGIEHATMHLIYFRFYHKLLKEFNLVYSNEPAKNLICQGMVLSPAFYQIDQKNNQHKWIEPSSIKTKKDSNGKIIKAYDTNGNQVTYAGMIKMSKSKKNGIEPELMINRYGADTIRLFVMFAAPIESSLEWNESGVKGIYRFLKKFWKLTFNYVGTKHKYKNINIDLLDTKQKEIYYLLHSTIAKVSDDIHRRKTFNTAISKIMELVNKLTKLSLISEEDKCIMRISLVVVIKMLYPFTPHFCFTLWETLNNNCNIDHEKWPTFEKRFLLKEYNIYIIQINAKTICTIKIKNNLNKKEILSYVKENEIVQKKIKNIKVNKTIYIPKKIINFIT